MQIKYGFLLLKYMCFLGLTKAVHGMVVCLKHSSCLKVATQNDSMRHQSLERQADAGEQHECLSIFSAASYLEIYFRVAECDFNTFETCRLLFAFV